MTIPARPIPWLLAACVLGAVPSPAAVAQDAASVEFFETRIRPLFAEHCYGCHGEKRQRGDLRLDVRAEAFADAGTGARIVPGDPAASRLMLALSYEDVDLQMPPRGKLDDADLEQVRRWIEAGAPWPQDPAGGDAGAGDAEPAFDLERRKQEHWAWAPIARPELPEVEDPAWAEHPVDRFLAARLAEHGLSPAGEASRRTLIRRLSFDLTGLPPTPEQIDRFLGDRSARAWEHLVDRLLESPHHGERWARHWMDLVRYAETYGHEYDYPIYHAWRYRDYLIRAFNDDLPYDRFLTEHVAGDLLETPRQNPELGTNESIVATGFWFLNQATHSPVDVRQDTAERIDNQIDVFSKTFLGMTVACARCHDHKFDAISTRDYYSLAGFLKSTRQQHALLDPHGQIGAITGRLWEVYRQGQELLEQKVRTPEFARDNPVASYLRATDEVRYGEPREGEVPDLRPDQVFEDFESGTYERWSVEGDVFQGGPATGTLANQNPVSGFEGGFLVNTFVGGDDPTGRATSQPFRIERDYVRFLIGGGAFEQRTCLNLRIDGEVVRSATGRRSEHLEPAHFDVREFQGRTAVLEIVDEQGGGWGHVNVDQIVFSDSLRDRQERRSLRAVAAEAALDPSLLRRWVDAVQDPAAAAPDHPLSAWSATAPGRAKGSSAAESPERSFAERLAELRTAAAPRADAAGYQLFEDFAGPDFGEWTATGRAFGDGPTSALAWDAKADGFGVLAGGAAHSGVLSERHEGVLRSPEFYLDCDNVHYRLAGIRGQVRMIIEGYTLDVFNDLLYGGMSFDVNTDGELRWHRQSVKEHRGHWAHIEIVDHSPEGFVAVDRIVFSDRPEPPPTSGLRERLAADGTVTSRDALAEWYQQQWSHALFRLQVGRADAAEQDLVRTLLERGLAEAGKAGTAALAAALGPLGREIREQAAALPEPLRALTAVDGTGVNEHVFIRGRHSTPGEEAPRQLLVAIAGEHQAPIQHGSGRRELARRMLEPSNPLPARVQVNRVWQHLFGRGLAPVPDNLGVLGEAPTHPELLDWLADWFRREGAWSNKALIRLLVTSRAYRMSSEPTDAAAEQADPRNQWLHRMRIRRLEGEAIRDAVLTVSGTLNPAMYGPSVPIHLTEFMDGRGRPGQSGPLDGDGRRSLYIEIRRNFLSPMMLAFDAPIPFTTIGRRTSSNVPAQALILMNDPFILQEARRWAERTIAATPSPEGRVERLYEAAFARPPTRTEKQRALAFLREQGREYDLRGDALWDDPRVWADYCHVLFNGKEFTFLP